MLLSKVDLPDGMLSNDALADVSATFEACVADVIVGNRVLDFAEVRLLSSETLE